MKYLSILTVIILVSGCVTTTPDNAVKKYAMKDVLRPYIRVKNTIPYKAELGDEDYWQTPKETLALKTGDCEDKAILLQHLFMLEGIKSKIIIGKSTDEADTYHAWNEVEINGKIYIADSTMNYFEEKKIDRHMFFMKVKKEHRPQIHMKKSRLRIRLREDDLELISDLISF
jgi:hypothetical protein